MSERLPESFGPFFPGMTLRIERGGDWIGVNDWEPDPTWVHIDEAGHAHLWQGSHGSRTDPGYGQVVGGEDNYPTLTWVVDPCTMGHGDDCTSEGHWICRTCHDPIVPGRRFVDRVWVDHGMTYTLELATASGGQGQIHTTYRFGQTEWDQLLDAVRTTVATTLEDFATEVRYGRH